MESCDCYIDVEQSRNISYCYDADASNDSADLNLSSSHEDNDHLIQNHHHIHNDDDNHETATLDISQDSHYRGYNDAIATPVNARCSNSSSNSTNTKVPFIPINEETMYLESSESPMPTISTSSPHSVDSWMNYSSHSSNEESSSISNHQNHHHRLHGSSEEDEGVNDVDVDDIDDVEEDDDDDAVAATKNKRICDNRFQFCDNDDVDMLSPPQPPPSMQINSKRHRGGSSSSSSTSGGVKIIAKSDSVKRKTQPKVIPSIVTRQSSTTNNKNINNSSSSISTNYNSDVDVRMIDFAHTTFLRKNSNGQTSSGTIHHGPDGGFITGINSLKRLLTEILGEN